MFIPDHPIKIVLAFIIAGPEATKLVIVPAFLVDFFEIFLCQHSIFEILHGTIENLLRSHHLLLVSVVLLRRYRNGPACFFIIDNSIPVIECFGGSYLGGRRRGIFHLVVVYRDRLRNSIFIVVDLAFLQCLRLL